MSRSDAQKIASAAVILFVMLAAPALGMLSGY